MRRRGTGHHYSLGAGLTVKIERVAVLGAGTMGHGIAQVVAQADIPVVIHDPAPGALDNAMDRIRHNLDKGIDLGRITDEVKSSTLALITRAASVGGAVEGADLVIEAAPELPEVKAHVFGRVIRAVRPGAMIATNTSSISIGELAATLPDPSRFIGLHFFNPVHVMRLVEVVWGPETSEDTRRVATRFVRRIGKEPVVVRDSPGFASSRLGIVLGMEAIRMVEAGVASAADIDRAMELGYRHPMGPLRLTDLVGLDVRLGIARYLHERLGSPAFEPPRLLCDMVAAGKLGKKAGRGFYEWGEE